MHPLQCRSPLQEDHFYMCPHRFLLVLISVAIQRLPWLWSVNDHWKERKTPYCQVMDCLSAQLDWRMIPFEDYKKLLRNDFPLYPFLLLTDSLWIHLMSEEDYYWLERTHSCVCSWHRDFQQEKNCHNKILFQSTEEDIHRLKQAPHRMYTRECQYSYGIFRFP